MVTVEINVEIYSLPLGAVHHVGGVSGSILFEKLVFVKGDTVWKFGFLP